MSRQPRAAATTPTRSASRFPIVAIGASAGGLEACIKFVEAVPDRTGMAFIIVQHLEPTHKSMMVDLLKTHTAMPVTEAIDGVKVEPNHVYLIPPGTYLALVRGRLKLSPPTARHGARMPFDFLLNSLAGSNGGDTVAIVLSGTGGDGSIGLQAIKAAGGLVIAQEPSEAGYDGMPQSAIETGAVDQVLKIADMPKAVAKFRSSGAQTDTMQTATTRYAEIIALLRTHTTHDFAHYKPGTIARRIDRRMAMLGMPLGDTSRYLAVLHKDDGELAQLGRDLLINVTSFFRDAKVFDALAKTVVPGLVRDQRAGQPLRIWIAGCSSGEEAYSIAIVFHEEIVRSKRSLKLQIFASDLDEDAIATAREGHYPSAIKDVVSPARLTRFFVKDDEGAYTVTPALRADVVFTVQNVLTDPPFSRLDMVSCRNLLIYLDPEAQQKVIGLFAFALRDNGVLVLGNAETTGGGGELFSVTSKSNRVYARLPRKGARSEGEAPVTTAPHANSMADKLAPIPLRHNELAELCRRLVVEAHAPAAVLINRKFECLYSLGPTERYLRVAPGHPTHDILAMASHSLRPRLRAAIEHVGRQVPHHVVAGCRTLHGGHALHFSLDLRSTMCGGEELILIAFVDEPAADQPPGATGDTPYTPGSDRLETELAIVRSELKSAVLSLELAEEERKAASEEASSVSEEFQSTNEELLTSKEELQSLNEELTALNTQLQETLERQRTTADDLQNILYSTDVATLFLDCEFNIRFFTPATRALFNVIPGDIGRPLADLRSLAPDTHLPNDARVVLKTGEALEREIAGSKRTWCRRIQPYRVHGGGVEGIVITFIDITDRMQVAEALEAAKQQAELANRAKSSFLAAASHDLRQPLQTLKLLEGLLEKTVESDKAKSLMLRFGKTLATMAGMLDTLLDINKIEAGTVRADVRRVSVQEVFDTLRDEFALHAQAKQLELRVVPCGLVIDSDPRLLEQMLRNLLTNALKYTHTGKILLGCRRRADRLVIQVCDTGIGIARSDLDTIFQEYRQLANGTRERDQGLGLGLSIVQRLGRLLNHTVSVASEVGQGSVFSIEIPRARDAKSGPSATADLDDAVAEPAEIGHIIYIIEDDDSVRETNELVLQDAGYATVAAADGAGMLALARGTLGAPSLILTDFNLPDGMDGLAVTAALRSQFGREIPAIILTGDISTASLRAIADHDCVHLSKPVKLKDLLAAIDHALTPAAGNTASASFDLSNAPVIFVVDDDDAIRGLLRAVLEGEGLVVETFACAEDFLAAYRPGREDCLLIDAYLPGINGLDLLRSLADTGHRIPSIMITGNSDVTMAVQAMKAGALDFIEKPVGTTELLVSVARALEQSRDAGKLFAWRKSAADNVAMLTSRQHEIMDLVLAGHPSKNIAADLGISQRTVENHRAAIMKKTGSKSVPELARLALSAASLSAGGTTAGGRPQSLVVTAE